MPNAPAMRERLAAQSIIEVLLLEQSLVPPRSALAKLFGRSPLGAAGLMWYRGAKAEIAVAGLLGGLSPEWTVFHALPAGSEGTDIDHVVVGPGGVFTIHTKLHRGKKVRVAGRTVVVEGERMPHIRRAEVEAARVTTLLRERMLLRASVRPVVAIVGAKDVTVYQKPAQVKVIEAAELTPWLATRPPMLNPEDRITAADIIDSPETWNALPTAHPQELLERFAQLDKSVRDARTQRLFWVPLGSAVVVASAAGLPYAIAAVSAVMGAH